MPIHPKLQLVWHVSILLLIREHLRSTREVSMPVFITGVYVMQGIPNQGFESSASQAMGRDILNSNKFNSMWELRFFREWLWRILPCWDMMPCRLVRIYQSSLGNCCLHHQGMHCALKTNAVPSSEMLINVCTIFLLMTNLTHFSQCTYFTPLHDSSNKCSSSGGPNCVNT
jgi:hypothetical protein